jgi:hypothetical protein
MPNPNINPNPQPRPQPPPTPRPHVDCAKVQHTCEILKAKGPEYAPIAQFLLMVTGCSPTVPPGK